MEDVFAQGDRVVIDRGLHRTIIRIELEDGEPRIYIRLRPVGRTARTVVRQLPAAEEGPFGPRQVVPYRPSKRDC